MATYHFEIKSGRNASDHADYVARQGFHRKREDLVESGHGNLPAWANDDPKVLWKAAEKFERKNGAVYREAIIALPGELTTEQNKVLVNDLVSKLCPGKSFQFAIHAPTSSLEGESNPHVHLMTSDRMQDGIERPAERFFRRYNSKQPEGGDARRRVAVVTESRSGKISSPRARWWLTPSTTILRPAGMKPASITARSRSKGSGASPSAIWGRRVSGVCRRGKRQSTSPCAGVAVLMSPDSPVDA